MRSLLRMIFIDHWLRKMISLVLAVIIWFVVDQSLTTTKTVNTISVRLTHLPDGKTIHGLQSSGYLNKKISLSITGKKAYIEELDSTDFEVVVDASGITKESAIEIQKKHLVSLNPDISIEKHVIKVAPKNIILKLVTLASEKIPVYVTQPIGEPPKGFHFLDIWPYNLYLTVRGPEEVIKKLKTRGLKLTFNLNDISNGDLERAFEGNNKDVVSFFIPEEWKSINIPTLSEKPVSIDDPDAKLLRIDLIRSDVRPIKFHIPINFFVPPDHAANINPASLHVVQNQLVQTLKGIKVLNKPLYTKGVSELFLKIIKDMVTLSINISPNSDSNDLNWSIQFINPSALEDRYVAHMMTEVIDDDELKDMQPRIREDYLRNRFRNYMNHFKLFTEEDKPLEFSVELSGKEITLKEKEK